MCQQPTRWTTRALALVIVPFLTLACGDDDSQEPEVPDLPSADGTALWSFLEEERYQETWDLWPGRGERYEGQEPHGMTLTTYLNESALEGLQAAGPPSMPVGAFIVKENYMPDGALAAITTMYKVDGFDPATNDWFWLRTTPEGEVEVEGAVQSCVDCHSAAADFDYVWLWRQDAS